MSNLNRRDFLKGSLAAGVALGLPACARIAPHARLRGANEDIRLGIIGIRGQGNHHINTFRNVPGVRVVALCDADSDILAQRVQEARDRNEPVKGYSDLRDLLDDPEVDAITTATPNHWHALVTIWACQAGKDVYVEKPVCHEIWEGRQMINAARKYNRIVQTGTQKRSDMGLKAAFEYIQAGNLGKIKVARGFCYKRRPSIGKVDGPQIVPANIDYNLWCGPAPDEPLMRKSLHYDWHWVWPSGNGDLGNQGIHEMDLCRWALGEQKLAPRVMSIGGRFGYIDDGTTPNSLITIFDYETAPLIFEVRGLPTSPDINAMDNYKGTRIGIVIECEDGYFAGGGGGGWVYDNKGNKIKQFKGQAGEGHHANFIKAVRSRKVEDLNADIYEGHISSSLCHMGNISYRLGAEANPHEVMEEVKGNGEMSSTYGRLMEHLEVNKVDLKQTPLIMGPCLDFNPNSERFTDSRKANGMLKRDYRKPFVVPRWV